VIKKRYQAYNYRARMMSLVNAYSEELPEGLGFNTWRLFRVYMLWNYNIWLSKLCLEQRSLIFRSHLGTLLIQGVSCRHFAWGLVLPHIPLIWFRSNAFI